MWNLWNLRFHNKNDMELGISQQITWNPKFHLIYNLKLHAKLYVVWKFSCNCQFHIKYNFHLYLKFHIKYNFAWNSAYNL